MVVARCVERIGLIARLKSWTDLVDIPERVGPSAVAQTAFAEDGRGTCSISHPGHPDGALEPERSIVPPGVIHQIVDKIDGLGAGASAVVVAGSAIAIGDDTGVGWTKENRDRSQYSRLVLGAVRVVVGPGQTAEIQGVEDSVLFEKGEQLRVWRPAGYQAGWAAPSNTKRVSRMRALIRRQGQSDLFEVVDTSCPS